MADLVPSSMEFLDRLGQGGSARDRSIGGAVAADSVARVTLSDENSGVLSW